MAVAPDGRVFIAQRAGYIRVVEAAGSWTAPAVHVDDMTTNGSSGGLLAIALDPDFARTRWLYVVEATDTGFRLARIREIGQQFTERVVLLDGIAASTRPLAALRFGPDARLYLGIDDGDVPAQAGDLGSYNGKVLRLNADGTTPSDQSGLTPVWATNLSAPRAFDWASPKGILWAVEGDAARASRLDRIVTEGTRSRRGRITHQYALPDRSGPSGVAVYLSDLIPEWRGDLLVSLADTQELLRLRLASNATTVMQTERVLQGEAGAIRALAISPVGTIYLTINRSLLELVPHAGDPFIVQPDP